MQSPEALRIARPGDAKPLDLGHVLKGYGTNLPHLLEVYCRGCNPPLKPGKDDKAIKAAYYRIYRRLKKLAAEGLITCKKGADGLVTAAPGHELFYLIRQVQNSNQRKPDDEKRSIYAWPKKCRPERVEAIKILNQWQHLPPEARQETSGLFKDYMADIADRRLVLGAADDRENLLVLPFLTRFNHQGRKIEALKKYDGIFAKTRDYYTDAVFLTLTTDPKRFTSLWHAGRHFSRALNRFFSFLRKRYGFRLPYICVFEFTPRYRKDKDTGEMIEVKSGLLHAHMILFGRKWLMKTQDISDEWDKCGQGIIVKPMALRNDPQHGWLWTKAKPEDCGNKDPQTYLKKYLIKALNSTEGHDLYWAFNKRYFTWSRRLKPDDLPARRRSRSARAWVFLGSFPWDSIPDRYTLNRLRPRPPPVEHGPPLLGRPETPGPDRIPLTRWGRLREDYRRRGLLKFRTALDIYRERKPIVDDASRAGGDVETNPATGEPYSLADFL